MKQQSKCINTKTVECQQSLVFYFMRTAKWVALGLLLGIGMLGATLQSLHHQEINWMFVSICILCGVILFWIGHCIMKSECTTKRQCGNCNKLSTVGNTSIRQA